MAEDKKLTVEKILADFRTNFTNYKKWLKAAEEDLEFLAGKQWDDEDTRKLDEIGVRALTINKIRPNMQLLSGLESQNRSDFTAYPEGEEDSIKAEIATALLKNVLKNSEGNFVASDQFEEGASIGASYVEPYIDYTYDMLYGQMKFRKLDYCQIFPGKHKEYDMSDAPNICKITTKLTKDEIVMLFPKQEKLFNAMEEGSIKIDGVDFSSINLDDELQTQDYGIGDRDDADIFDETKYFDLLEYYYKKYVPHYYIADKKLGKLKEVENKEDADNYVTAQNMDGTGSAASITRFIPEIWCAAVVGNKLVDDYKCEFYPRWKGYPIFPMWGFKLPATLKNKNREYNIQGIVRMLKDPQREVNKRRTQELRHLNQSANSGWYGEEDSFVDRDKWESHSSAPGVILEYKKGYVPPTRIMPTPLSQGHSQLVAENSQDMKEISGINTDLLAMNEKQASGRAINIRQKQGLVMVQKLFDNFSRTKKIWGKFVLSQLGEIYDVDTAVRVLGDAFIQQNFSRPVLVQDPMTGEQKPQLDEKGDLVIDVDPKAVATMFQSVLNDTGLGVYDVAIGEAASSDTTRLANWMTMVEMQTSGIAIPPDVIIGASNLANADKEKIKSYNERQQQAAIEAAQAKARQPMPMQNEEEMM